MSKDFVDRLAKLAGASFTSVEAVEYEEPAKDDLYAVGTKSVLSDGTTITMQFWRLLKSRPHISIFDHRQQYGLQTTLDAISILRAEIQGKKIVSGSMSTAGDLLFHIENELVLEIFNFTSFEIWEVEFRDGTGALSNYVLGD